MGIQDSFRRNIDGKILSEVLVDLLDKFPDYDLMSEKGVEEAIHDIEASLKPIASFVPREYIV